MPKTSSHTPGTLVGVRLPPESLKRAAGLAKITKSNVSSVLRACVTLSLDRLEMNPEWIKMIEAGLFDSPMAKELFKEIAEATPTTEDELKTLVAAKLADKLREKISPFLEPLLSEMWETTLKEHYGEAFREISKTLNLPTGKFLHNIADDAGKDIAGILTEMDKNLPAKPAPVMANHKAATPDPSTIPVLMAAPKPAAKPRKSKSK